MFPQGLDSVSQHERYDFQMRSSQLTVTDQFDDVSVLQSPEEDEECDGESEEEEEEEKDESACCLQYLIVHHYVDSETREPLKIDTIMVEIF